MVSKATTNRPYQKAHDCDDALRIIHSLSGKRLDPDAIAALDAVFKRGEIQVPAVLAMAAGASNEAAPASMVFPPANAAIEMDRA
jgi:HD-GYP domain-containing protein (c-di-GMP phosphodiesterase class II)